MRKTDTGSYEFDSYGKQETELQMLEHQASVALMMEQLIWRECGLKEGMKVLDLGCGSGIISRHLADFVGSGSVTGVDPSEMLIAEAGRQLQEHKSSNLKFATGDAYHLKYENNSFDFIYCRLLFQHLRHPEKALREIKRLLKPKGIVCIVDVDDALFFLYPYPEKLDSLIDRAALAQLAEGGDRSVGRKLPVYLDACGFSRVRADVKNISSYDIGLPAFLKMSVDFRTERLPESQIREAGEELENIYRLLGLPQAWGSMGMIVASAAKNNEQ